MADKKLNEVPVVSDIVTIFGKRSNGEIVQIDKNNLATLLGGLLPIVSETSNGLAWKGGFISRPKITSNMSIDNYTNPGMYGLDGCQDSPYKYGGLIIFRTNVLVVQIVYDMQGSNRPKYRQNWANQGWQSWYSF
jgi:hypothetical protein